MPLSDKGQQQALALAQYFADKNIEKIWSSAVLRCKQTAVAISSNQVPVAYDQRLLETFSAFQGHWFDDDQLDWSHFFNHRHELGGESYADIQQRMISFFTDLLKSDETNIIVCSHGDPLYMLYLYLSKGELPAETDEVGTLAQYQPKASIRPVQVKNGSYLLEEIITF